MRDHCKDLLLAIAEDLDEEQTSHEQSRRSDPATGSGHDL